MEDIIVGSKDCSIRDIVRAIMQSSVAHKLIEDWSNLALHLDTSPELKITLKGETKVVNILESLIEDWKLRTGNGATLQKLQQVLQKGDYNDFVTWINAKFQTDICSKGSKPESQDASCLDSSLKNHLQYNLVTLIEKTYLSDEIIENIAALDLLTSAEMKILKEIANPEDQKCYFWKTVTEAVTKNEDKFGPLILFFRNDQINHRNGVTRLLNSYYNYHDE